MRFGTLAVVTCFIAVASAHAQVPRAVSGRVFDEITDCPLAGTAIRVVGDSARTTTNVQGRYRLTSVPAGTFMLEATHVGYQASSTLGLTASDSSVRVDFSLVRATGDSARPGIYPAKACHLEAMDAADTTHR